MTTGGPVEGGSRFVVVAGLDEGRVFALEAPEPPGGWVIGRGRGVHLDITGDPSVARAHALVLERGGAHVLVRADGDGLLFHNWRTVEAGSEAVLAAGDLVEVGMTLLMYRPA